MTTKNRIEEIKNYGYDIDFSEIFNKSLENYKKIALQAGVVFILFSLIILAIVIGIIGAFVGVSAFTSNLANFKIENFSAATILIYVLFVSLISGLASPLSAGILKMAHNASNRQEFSIGTAFEYYKGTYFKELFVAALLISFLTLGVSTLLDSLHVPFVGSLIVYIISFFTFLTVPLIIFGNLKAMDAIQGSFTIVSKQLFVLIGLLLVAAIIAMLGFVGFCIGIFFTLPFLYATYYCIYDGIIGTGFQSELDEIGFSVE